MSNKKNRSRSGVPIYRDCVTEREFIPAIGDEQTIGAMERHIKEYTGATGGVFHEIISDMVHIDIYHVAPTLERNYHTLITCGMSDHPMKAPENHQDKQFAEVMVCLPPDWQVEQEAFNNEENYWPIRWLKILARFPHEYNTWLWKEHTVPYGDPPEPYTPTTRLCCALLLPPTLFPEGFDRLRVSPEKEVQLLAFVPIYREEMDFILNHGHEPLLDRFKNAGINELLDVHRKNVCKRSWWLW